MHLNPYIIFDGQCRDAFTVYAQILGGDLSLHTYAEMPPSGEGPTQPGHHIMHARLDASGAVLMGADGPGGEPRSGVWISIGLHDEAEAERIFAALATDGRIVMPIGPTFWARRFGMVVDRFGVSWMVNCE